MLVAGTSLGFIAPIAATANEVTINDFNPAEELAVTNSRVDGLEARLNDFEAGSFSDTTTLDGSAIFTLSSVDTEGAKDGVVGGYTGDVVANYTYTMNLNSSFTGDDNLYVRIKTGNHNGATNTQTAYNTYASAGNGNFDILEVDKIWYTTPIGENNTIWVGPRIENYYMHGTTPSIYKPVLKAFTLGGNAAAYGASTMAGAGWAYNADNGFAVSSNFVTKGGNTTGILNDEGATSWATQVGYTKPQYSISAILNQKYNGWADSYFMSTQGKARPGDGSSTNIGLRGWWRPENTGTATPSISVGYDTSETDATNNSNTNAYFVGLNWQDIFSADDRIGIAFGQPQKHEDDVVDPFLYEVYYDYKVNDSITVTPTIFGGTSNDGNDKEVDMTGYLINTTFKF